MRVIVTGGRGYQDANAVYVALMNLRPRTVVQGGASGADKHARDWCSVRGTHCVTFAADWKKHGKAAGPIRNQQMIDAGADLVLAFPGGRGTADCVARAKAAGITVMEVK